MSDEQQSVFDSRRLRRAKSPYVLALTGVTVWFWWLVVVSQTSLGSRESSRSEPALADAPPAVAAVHDGVARLAAAEQTVDSARAATAAARVAADAARQALEAALAQRSAARPPEAPAETVVDRGTNMVANPQYTELSQTLKRLTAERDEQLQRLLPEHPAVKDLAARIEAVSQQLAATPEVIAGPASEPAADGHGQSEPAGSAADGLALSAPSADEDKQVELRKGCDAAEAEWQRCLQQEQESRKIYDSLRGEIAAAPPVAPKDIAPPAPISPASGQWGTLLLSVGALLAVEALAMRVALALMASERMLPLASVAQVAALLPVPVLAAFPSHHAARPKLPQPGSVSAMTVWLLVCEGTMAVLAFLLTALTIRSIGFPIELLRHPIEAMADALRSLYS